MSRFNTLFDKRVILYRVITYLSKEHAVIKAQRPFEHSLSAFNPLHIHASRNSSCKQGINFLYITRLSGQI